MLVRVFWLVCSGHPATTPDPPSSPKSRYSKDRRVDPQVIVGLLVDRQGFPLEIGSWGGKKAETTTIIPIIEVFQARYHLADMGVVADAGMLSSANLKALDEAGLRFIVGSRTEKTPGDLASHFRWHGDAFTDGQLSKRSPHGSTPLLPGPSTTPR